MCPFAARCNYVLWYARTHRTDILTVLCDTADRYIKGVFRSTRPGTFGGTIIGPTIFLFSPQWSWPQEWRVPRARAARNAPGSGQASIGRPNGRSAPQVEDLRAAECPPILKTNFLVRVSNIDTT